MKYRFYKMQGIGNDYIYFDCFEKDFSPDKKTIAALSDRRFGIGGDGVILIKPCEDACARMEMYNADGSRAQMCGNGIRCVGKFLYDTGRASSERIKVMTDSGLKELTIHAPAGIAKTVSVEMGMAAFECAKIPVLMDTKEYVDSPVIIDGKKYLVTCVSVGNPHCVTLVDFVDAVDIERIGPQFENNVLFPERINTEFVQLEAPDVIKMRVWERGTGETLACGTGACAVAAACVRLGLCKSGTPLKLKLRGGELEITVRDDYTIRMTGPAEMVFTGEIEL